MQTLLLKSLHVKFNLQNYMPLKHYVEALQKSWTEIYVYTNSKISIL